MSSAKSDVLAVKKRTINVGAFVAGGSVICLAAVSVANAQTTGNEQAADNSVGEIVVSATRIKASGFSAPTPTTVIGAEAIQQAAQPNLFTAVAELPSLQGSTGTTVNTGITSAGNNGLSSLNLRGLGPIRTLTLLDGQRVVPAYVQGLADVSLFPQLLIQRVDVVTGGASASWGSDAVSGVVNFVTDKRFEGLKANVQGASSTYGDDNQGLIQVAAGHSFLGDKLHAEVSGEYYSNGGVPAPAIGGGMENGRPDSYRSNSTSYGLSSTPAGQSQYYYYPYNAQLITQGRNGLITAGPLQGTAFGIGGQPYTFQYGGSGIPAYASTPRVVGCVASVCPGGQQDNFDISGGNTTLDDPLHRAVWYGRVSYDVLPKIEVYTTVTYGEVWSTNQAVAGAQKPNLTLQCSNAFLPPSVAAACATAKVTSFTFGTENADFPAYERILTDRRERRFVVGSDGSFDVFEKPITFDSYFEHGEDDVTVNIENMTLNPRYNAAIAAVRNSSGQIVCGTATAVAAGCVPWNVFGDLQNGAEAYSYIAPSNGPYQHTFLTENAASLSFNTSPFRNWAGDVSLAWGGEWRKESYTVSADPYGNGVSAATPYTAAYPSDPVLSSSGNNWYAGNFHNGSGAYSVREAFLEMVLPLWDGAHFGKADLNVAGRVTDYSTSGTVETWKAGGTWDTPLEGLRIRGVRSRDIRAPNLSELFAAPQTQIVPVINRATGVNVQVVTETLGNPNLKPERSDNSEVGLVYSPKWLSGFDISFDYFNIDVREAISTLTIQQEEDLCFNGNAQFCSVVSFNGVIGGPVQPTIIVQPFNLASLTTKGFDIEASYRFELRKWGVPGSFLFRGLATHTIDYISNPGIPGQIVQQFAGFNGTNGTAGDPGTPRWKAYLPQSWTVGPATFTFTERLVSAGYINPNYIVCQVSCPAPTVQHPTTNFNSIPGAIYLDAGGSYQWTSTQLYFKVDNLANRRAPPFGSPTIYDFVGRMFRVGVRLDF